MRSCVLILGLMTAASLEAQVVHRKPDPPARRAGIAPPPPAPAPGTPGTPGTVAHPVAVPVAAGLIPAVLMSDGRVFADFGFGLEQIVRPCAVAAVPTTASHGSRPNSDAGARSAGTSAGTATRTAGIAPPPQPQPAGGRCWTRDATGRLFVAP
jgi:hypothetical protein